MRQLVLAFISAFPLFMIAEEIDATSKIRKNSWAFMPIFNINIPGNWKTLHATKEPVFSYGAGLGLNYRIFLKFDIFIDANLSFCYDSIDMSSFTISDSDFFLHRWSVPLSVNLGYPFKLTEDKDIVPLVGQEFSYGFCHKYYRPKEINEYNHFNFSWGFGCGLRFYDKYEIDVMGYFGLFNFIKQTNMNTYDNKIRMSLKYFF